MIIETRTSNYRRKIKTRAELKEIIGSRPRSKTVIMCHGTFDIVHPGHIRHLMYAKDKADILVASLTCDNHINKANFRPFIPEQLRAMNNNIADYLNVLNAKSDMYAFAMISYQVMFRMEPFQDHHMPKGGPKKFSFT